MMQQIRRSSIGWIVAPVLAVACSTWPGTFAVAREATPAARAAAERIQGRQVAARVRFLASDFMEGREAGTNGERLASEYIRDFYLGLGLQPAGTEGSFYQRFDLHERTLGEGNAFAVVRKSGDSELHTSYPLEDGFVPFNFSPSASVTAPVVLAGYGISASEYKYDDYAGLDVNGAIVLVLRHEPAEADPDSPFKGLRSTKHAAFLSKVRLAQRNGAVGLILVTDPLNHTPETRDPGNRLARWHSLVEREDFDERPQPKPRQFYPEIAPDVRIPAVHVSPATADDLIAGLGRSLESIQREIDEKLKPASRKLPGVMATITTDIHVGRVPVRNVIARIEGSDPVLREEAVVIGAHYDHVGRGYFGSRTGHWGRIHPGADDNASGTACLLSIAEAVSRADRGPGRSLVFIHFTAEEKGLWGARWFVEHPTVPLDKIVAMVNLDMVGRNEPNVVSIASDSLSAGLDGLVKQLGERELKLSLNNDVTTWIDRSDQWAFSLKGIPSVALTGGSHEEYHTPQDRASLIVADKLASIARLATLTAWTVAEEGPELIRAPAEGEE